MNSDKQIIQDVLSGHPESFGELVRKYQDRLFNTLVHILGDTHEAEEVVQDALLNAYSKLATFRGKSQFYTWLYRIAFNLAMSRQRKKKNSISLDSVEPVGGDSPEANLEQEERAKQLRSAISRLGQEFRSVLVLREMEDCDYETISSMLDIPVGTVRSRLHRARSMLRELLREAIGEPDFPT